MSQAVTLDHCVGDDAASLVLGRWDLAQADTRIEPATSAAAGAAGEGHCEGVCCSNCEEDLNHGGDYCCAVACPLCVCLPSRMRKLVSAPGHWVTAWQLSCRGRQCAQHHHRRSDRRCIVLVLTTARGVSSLRCRLMMAHRRRRPGALRVRTGAMLQQLPVQQRRGLDLLPFRGVSVRRRLRAVVLLLPARCERC